MLVPFDTLSLLSMTSSRSNLLRWCIPAITLITSLITSGCAHKGTNPIDPYEPFNRRVHKFNMTLDKYALKPVAIAYKSLIPLKVRVCINNAYNNLDLIPSVANDLLQAEGKWAIKDSWRFVINSSLGVGGLFDVATHMSLPPHSNDLGLTFAKWGDKKSPYLVLPFLGPSTIRDGSGWLFQFFLYSPYVYIDNDTLMYGLLGLRYVDLRAQLLETDPIINEALDPYSFIRDAYLQHRQYIITGSMQDTGTLPISGQLVDVGVGSDYVDE
jgi:phospholipid-binding lipoprotein MlaA